MLIKSVVVLSLLFLSALTKGNELDDLLKKFSTPSGPHQGELNALRALSKSAKEEVRSKGFSVLSTYFLEDSPTEDNLVERSVSKLMVLDILVEIESRDWEIAEQALKIGTTVFDFDRAISARFFEGAIQVAGTGAGKESVVFQSIFNVIKKQMKDKTIPYQNDGQNFVWENRILQVFLKLCETQGKSSLQNLEQRDLGSFLDYAAEQFLVKGISAKDFSSLARWLPEFTDAWNKNHRVKAAVALLLNPAIDSEMLATVLKCFGPPDLQ